MIDFRKDRLERGDFAAGQFIQGNGMTQRFLGVQRPHLAAKLQADEKIKGIIKILKE